MPGAVRMEVHTSLHLRKGISGKEERAEWWRGKCKLAKPMKGPTESEKKKTNETRKKNIGRCFK